MIAVDSDNSPATSDITVRFENLTTAGGIDPPGSFASKQAKDPFIREPFDFVKSAAGRRQVSCSHRTTDAGVRDEQYCNSNVVPGCVVGSARRRSASPIWSPRTESSAVTGPLDLVRCCHCPRPTPLVILSTLSSAF